ncbi:MAG: neutral/alkaline non-lysosomal ceramidase N-terminal domain-containing protein [bacterium]
MKKATMLAAAIVMLIGTGSFALGLGGAVSVFSEGAKAPYPSFLFDNTPDIASVTQTPSKPLAGQKVKVSAVVTNDSTRASMPVKSVFIFFSADGGAAWDSAEMIRSDSDSDYFFAYLPAAPAGARVVYYIQATDTAGGMTTEMPGPAVVEKDSYRNMVGIDDISEGEDAVPADIDIRRLEAGYDDQYMYVHLVLEGKPGKGDISKKGMYAYLIPVLNLDKNTGGISELFNVPLLAYAPILSSYLGVGPSGLFSLSEVMKTKKSIEGSDVKLKKGDNDLFFRFNRAALGENKSGKFEIGALTAAIKTMDGLLPWEATSYLTFILKNHEYTVGSEDPAPVAFKAGAAQADITPPVGTPLSGYGERMGKASTGIHDPLMAQALVLDAGGEKVVFVTADFFMMRRSLYKQIAQLAEKATGIPRDRIMISGSHAHSSSGALFPELALLGGAYNKDVYEKTRQKFVDLIVEANKKMQPARVGAGQTQAAGLNVNRREDGGPTDPDLRILRVDDLKGKPIAVLYNFSAHPTVMGGGNLLFSAEYPGSTRKYMAKQFPGSVVMFANSSLGNSGPGCPGDCGGGFDTIEKQGELMTGFISAAMKNITTTEKAKFTFLTEEILMNSAFNTWITMDALRIGDAAFVTAPGEPYVEIGFPVKKAAADGGFPICFLMGVTNDGIGYIIPKEWYDKHVYEALFAIFGPMEGEFLRDSMVSMIKELK